MKLRHWLLGLIPLAGICNAEAGDFAIKTNLLYDATASVNIGAELAVAPRWSIDLNADLNDWSFSGGKRWKHWFAQPEVRYWFCEALNGNFIGLELHGGQYNVGSIGFPDFNFLGTNFAHLKDSRYQGWFAGAGVTYGHAWMLAKHWNIEAEIGIGWAYTRYDRFPCKSCGSKIASDKPNNYFGPTKAALNLVYIF
ncbi:MAG: DUF3575 domain-containing protein [Muribaculaceae bacterium]|nr:DUF3575 domain-containing protein [Muribaculaceae bacterium]